MPSASTAWRSGRSAVAGGLVLLVGGADAFVRGASALALRLGWSPLVVGFTVVAFGTSAPELAVSLEAAFGGSGDLALGNVLGSNVANVGLILGASALVRSAAVAPDLLRRDVPALLIASVVLAGLLLDDRLSRADGTVLLLGLVGYVAFTLRQSDSAAAEGLEAPAEARAASGWRTAALSLGGLIALVLGADVLIGGATGLAATLGVPEPVIGLTLVAVGTSLPELATSLTAALRGQADLAVGNVVGSNIFNVLGVLGTSALVRPLVATEGAATAGWTGTGAVVAAALLASLLLWTGRRLDRWEGAVLLAAYAAYLFVLL